MEETYIKTNIVKLCFERLHILMGLNLFFIITCIPIITIPSSITALHYACQQSILNKSKIFRCYFHSLKQNFISSIPLGIMFGGLIFIIVYCTYFYLELWNGNLFSIILSLFCMICVFILIYASSIAFAMMARVQLNTRQIIRNSFILLLSKMKDIFFCFFFSIVVFVIFMWFFPYSTPLIMLYGFSLPCFIKTRGILPIIDAYITTLPE